MKHFFELLTDKRFSLRFRILNTLSGDYLRNYLAIGILFHVNKCDEILNKENLPNSYRIEALKESIAKVKKGIYDIWNI